MRTNSRPCAKGAEQGKVVGSFCERRAWLRTVRLLLRALRTLPGLTMAASRPAGTGCCSLGWCARGWTAGGPERSPSRAGRRGLPKGGGVNGANYRISEASQSEGTTVPCKLYCASLSSNLQIRSFHLLWIYYTSGVFYKGNAKTHPSAARGERKQAQSPDGRRTRCRHDSSRGHLPGRVLAQLFPWRSAPSRTECDERLCEQQHILVARPPRQGG